MVNKSGQIWVETALYLLIGIALIGIFLAFATPEIQKQKDRIIFESSLDAMIDIDNSILELRRMGAGNQKKIDFLVRKGTLRIEAGNDAGGENDKIVLVIDGSRYVASEIGRDYPSPIDVPGTNLKVLTEKSADKYDITITREFENDAFNITYNSNDELKQFSMAPTSYTLIIKNQGRYADGKVVINVNEVSS